jgi:signal transduction histidine kinase/ligand-binding sensor domain-containing protein/DNA-binding response OmpR family regulator
MWKLPFSLALVFVFFVPSGGGLYGQQKPLKFKNFTKDDGLSSSDITSIAQTPDGYLWIGTSDGLNRFDGYEFTVFRNDPQNHNSIADNNITTLHVDKTGTLWIGTRTSGLSRYDSKREVFRNYKSVLYDKNSLSNYYVLDVEEDTRGDLWIATTLGLNRYRRDTDDFERYFHQVSITVNRAAVDSVRKNIKDERIAAEVAKLIGESFADETVLEQKLVSALPGDDTGKVRSQILKASLLRVRAEKIRIVEADHEGNLWFAYEKEGLALYNPSDGKLTSYSDGTQDPFWSKEIRSLYASGNTLWIGTRDGSLASFDVVQKKLTKLTPPGVSNNIESITKDFKGNLWFGDDYGLCRVSSRDKSAVRYQNEEGNQYSLVTSSIKVIFEDAHRNLWVGCAQGGLSLTVSSTLFDHYKHDLTSEVSLSKNHVSSVLEDSHGNVWIGYYTMGIDVWNRQTNQIKRFNYIQGDRNGIGKGTVFALFEDSKGIVWVGTYEGGLQYFDPKTNRFHSLTFNENDPYSISGNDVRSITEDGEGNIWIAIHGHGVNRVDRSTLKATRYFADYDNLYNSLGNDWVYVVYADRHDNIWAGTVFGLSVLYKGAKNFVTYNRSNSNLSHDHVRTISEDRNGNLWFGTQNGLTRFDPATRNFTIFNQKDGLPNNMIHGVLDDPWGYLWVSTNNGMSRLDYKEGKTLNFTELDGLQGAEFFTTSCFKGKNGAMYFGGTNGLNVFYPEAVATDSAQVPIAFSKLTLFNRTVSPGNSILEKSINTDDEITFRADQNVFSISFVGLSFRNAEKIQYAYQLEGFDSEWTYVSNRREVTYTNLDPGTYHFKVKAANASGVWNKSPRTLRIVVLPPFWKTPWAYGVYVFVISGFLYLYRRMNIAREKLKSDMKMKELEAKKTHEIDTLKLKFFTNISHEFKTPLTLINGPVETLLNKNEELTEAKRFEFYNLIHRNSQHLLRLINQLLDMSAIDAGFMKLKVSRGNVVSFCRNIAGAFSYVADTSGVRYEFQSNVVAADVYFDHDKVEKILYNLISNALKHTSSGGKVTVRIALADASRTTDTGRADSDIASTGTYVQLEVEDTGVGIPGHMTAKVFERFYQGENSARNGTGIGLALTRQLVERHYGSIQLRSEEGKGSCFTVWLPVYRERFTREEIVNVSPTLLKKNEESVAKQETFSEKLLEFTRTDVVRPVILIVEDNDDVRKFLRLHLSADYTLYEACGGNEGVEKAIEIVPDLILSDVVMPDGNGFELCERVKSDKRTSHIPVVLLTARDSESNVLEGLNYGAEDYITKPFNMSILKAKVRNLILARQRVQDKFYTDLNFDPVNLASNSIDKNFVNQMIAAIEANLSDENFNPDTLADNLNVSRSQLYKKVKGLTGLSVSIFVRNIRLRKAALLLKTNSFTVSEVAYEVGFSDPGYFTKCFREMYSKSPTEFMKKPVDV